MATINDLLTAAQWLECNEGDNGEAEACKRVAAMLRNDARKREERSAVYAAQKYHGIRASAARDALKKLRAKTEG